MLLIHGSEDEKASVAAVGLYEDIYDPEQFEVYIVEGSNHQFSSLDWKQQVYDKSIEFLKKQIG
jgi:dipeptidyl aminopeptidase/acylaminoacyl peptidase